jgi:hypothetical protein
MRHDDARRNRQRRDKRLRSQTIPLVHARQAQLSLTSKDKEVKEEKEEREEKDNRAGERRKEKGERRKEKRVFFFSKNI